MIRWLATASASILLAVVGVFGLVIDMLFHWSSVCYVDHECGLLATLRELLIDVDPGTVPFWLTGLGIVAHTMFLGGFSLLVLIAVLFALRRWRASRTLWQVREARSFELPYRWVVTDDVDQPGGICFLDRKQADELVYKLNEGERTTASG